MFVLVVVFDLDVVLVVWFWWCCVWVGCVGLVFCLVFF